jgi:hypothetical protein
MPPDRVFAVAPAWPASDAVAEGFPAQALIAPEGFQILAAREQRIQRQFLRHPAQLGARCRGAGWLAEDADAAGIEADASGDAANERGFAGAVGTEQAEAGPLADFEGDARDGGQVTEALDDGVEAQGDRGHRRGHAKMISRGASFNLQR